MATLENRNGKRRDNQQETTSTADQSLTKKPRAAANGDASNTGETPADRAAQKLLRLQRKAAKDPSFSLIQELKKLWEQIRLKTLSKESRQSVIASTISMVQGHIKELIFKHDASRIVQSLIKYSNATNDRHLILNELRGNYVELAQSTYGRFVVLKALKYAPNAKERSVIIQEFVKSKSSVKLIRHKFASVILDTIYCLYANSKERQCLLDEFYGGEYQLSTSAGQSPKEGGQWNLSKALGQFPDRKSRILSQMQEILRVIIGKEGTIGANEIVHRALYEFMENLELQQLQELVMKETGPFHPLIAQLPTFVHTKFGSRIAMIILAAASAKDRKLIVKSLKPYAKKIAQDSYGWMVLARVFDCVDDTVLVKGSIVNEIFAANDEAPAAIITDKNSVQLLLYVLAGQTTKYFSPDLLKMLNIRSDLIKLTSKKDPQVRAQEIRSVIIKPIVKELEDEATCATALSHWSDSLVIYELVKYLGENTNISEMKSVLKSVVEMLGRSDLLVNVQESDEITVATGRSTKIADDDSESDDESEEEKEKEGEEEKGKPKQVSKYYQQSMLEEQARPSVTRNPLLEKNSPRIIKRLAELTSFRNAVSAALLTETFLTKLFGQLNENQDSYPSEPFLAIFNLIQANEAAGKLKAIDLIGKISKQQPELPTDTNNGGLQKLKSLYQV